MDDVRAVMDAVGSKRAAFYGLSEGAAMSILFAATYPERTAALVVRSAFPRRMWAPDYPWGRTEEDYQREVDRDLRMFGPRDVARESVRALGRFEDEEVEAFMEMVRFGSSPGALEALHRMNKEIDIRHVLPAVRVPTLVLHGGWTRSSRSRSRTTSPRAYRRRDSSRSRASATWPSRARRRRNRRRDQDVHHRSVGVGRLGESEPDRVLATILFTDIVGSTAQAAELGDRALAGAARAPSRAHPAAARPFPRTRARHGRRRLLRLLRRAGARDPVCECDRRGGAATGARDPRGPAHR